MRKLISSSLMLFMPLSLFAQTTTPNDSLNTDSIHNDIQLNEVVVKGSRIINKSDRKLIMPSDKQREMAHTGTDLVRLMQMPDVKVDPVSNSLYMASAGNLKLRINGRPVDSKDIHALDPKQIVRVEYHDNPSMRYGDADLVLDFIVKTNEHGGRLDAAVQTVPTHGFELQQDVDLAINYKRSEFKFGWYSEHVQDFKMWRENTETYNLAAGSSFTRTESGIPTPMKMDYANAYMTYNYYNPDKELLSANLSLSGDWNDEELLKGVLHSTQDDTDALIEDFQRKKSISPNLDIYYQRNIDKDRMLIFNVVGKYSPNKDFRNYKESMYADGVEGEQTYNIANEINNRSYSMLAEADYEQSWGGKRRITVGGRYSGSWTRTEYLTYNNIQHLDNNNGDVFAEWWWQICKKLDMTAGLGGSLKSYNIRGSISSTKWMWKPKLNLRYRLEKGHTLRLNYSAGGTTPSLGQLSSVRQQVDGYQASVGNSGLQPYMTHNFSFKYEYTHNTFYGQLMANYTLAHHPIANEKYWDEGVVLSTYDNQKNYHKLYFRAMASGTVIPDWVDMDASLAWTRMIFQGNRYCHSYNQLIPSVELQVNHWGWTFLGMYNATPRSLWGETVSMSGSNGGNYHILGLIYSYKNWQFMAVVINLFGNSGGIESSNLNKYAGYKRNIRYDFTDKAVAFKVNYNINWGRKYQSADKKLSNEASAQSASTAKK